jgi:hypothetical protein
MIPQEIKDLLKDISSSKAFKVFIVILFFAIGTMGVLIFNLPKDNIVEQIAVEVIKIETGIDVDFTDKTGEK